MNDKPTYNPNIHHRRSIRLKGYDYSQAGLYFITICCQDRACLFGHIENGEMVLNDAGRVAFDEWIKTPELRSNVELGEFIVMPNHIHGIVRLLGGRGELHSPNHNSTNHNSPNHIAGESNGRPNNNGESNADESNGRTNNNADELHSPDNDVVDGRGELHSPNHNLPNHIPVESNGRTNNNAGESNSPNHNLPNHIAGESNAGECNSPLRGPSQTIGAVVRGYKSSVTKQLGLLGINRKIWQRNYYEHIIRNDESYNRIAQYIATNPKQWKEDKFYFE